MGKCFNKKLSQEVSEVRSISVKNASYNPKPKALIPNLETGGKPRSPRQIAAQKWRDKETAAWVEAGMPELFNSSGGKVYNKRPR